MRSQLFVALFLSVCCSFCAAQEISPKRVWKDKSGSFRVEATLESVTAEKVRLKRSDDGRTIDVALSSLAEADIDFVRAFAPHLFKEPDKRILTAAALETAAQRRRYAIDALAMYDKFIADVRVPIAEKELAKKNRERWVVLADAKKTRVASKWHSPAEYKDLVNDELAMLRSLYDFRTITDWSTFDSKLKQASAINPASIRAEFVRGFLQALQGRPEEDAKERYVKRSAADAEDRFELCIRRLLDYQVDLTGPERANLAACYNNLALACMRQRKYAEALRNWQKCLESAPPDQAVLHNLGQFEAIVNQGQRNKAGILLSPEENQLLRRIGRSIGGIPTAYDRTRGWRYMPLVPVEAALEATLPAAAAPAAAVSPATDLQLAGGGTGFVVGKGLIVTNQHVVNGQIGFTVRRDSEDKVAARPARLVAVSTDPKVDLAVLKCDELDAPAFALCANYPKLSTEIRTLGFPEFFELGTSVKVSGGIITALPPQIGLFKKEWEDCLMHDAITAPGSSGGPVFDSHGLIVGIHTGSVLDKFKVAMTSVQAAKFLAPHVANLQVKPPSADESRKWEEVVAAARESTVHILCFSKPDRFSPIIAQLGPDKPGGGFLGRSNEIALRQYDDCWCLACYGSRRLDCPERECSQGTVKTVKWDVVVRPNGAVTKQGTPLRVNCPTCDGRGVISCDFCQSGIDPRFR